MLQSYNITINFMVMDKVLSNVSEHNSTSITWVRLVITEKNVMVITLQSHHHNFAPAWFIFIFLHICTVSGLKSEVISL